MLMTIVKLFTFITGFQFFKEFLEKYIQLPLVQFEWRKCLTPAQWSTRSVIFTSLLCDVLALTN